MLADLRGKHKCCAFMFADAPQPSAPSCSWDRTSWAAASSAASSSPVDRPIALLCSALRSYLCTCGPLAGRHHLLFTPDGRGKDTKQLDAVHCSCGTVLEKPRPSTKLLCEALQLRMLRPAIKCDSRAGSPAGQRLSEHCHLGSPHSCCLHMHALCPSLRPRDRAAGPSQPLEGD